MVRVIDCKIAAVFSYCNTVPRKLIRNSLIVSTHEFIQVNLLQFSKFLYRNYILKMTEMYSNVHFFCGCTYQMLSVTLPSTRSSLTIITDSSQPDLSQPTPQPDLPASFSWQRGIDHQQAMWKRDYCFTLLVCFLSSLDTEAFSLV